ncbi:dnaJ homolog subfamily B member 1-like [Anopheles albimanus]|uniref:Uncharacterized protein n=1 Tax=Anopheles albimanus TaxID=7167 RepID=A0A182F6Y0_ANOAL|nr:dnaJ homolog subfamily B member 1-like [Anopheles albimanus]
MEVNKDEAQRCVDLALKAFKAGDTVKAEKLLKKSKTLYPLERADVLLKLIKNAGTGAAGSTAGAGSASSARRKPVNRDGEKAPEPKLNVDYTQEQADVVKRVQKCKDFYEVLGVTQDTPDTEIKKCYKKLALQLHPDKNKSPGAMEAFKALGNAVETLTDPQKRKAYDLYRTTDNGTSSSFGSSPRSSRGGFGQNGFTYRPDFESEINPNDLFNMFFGSGFAQQQQQQHHFYRARASRNSHHGEGSGSQPSLVFGLILCFIVVSLLSTFFASDPLYSLQQTTKYSVERHTLNHKIPYYVKSNFLNDYQGSLARLEYSVEEEYLTYMKRACSNERAYRDAMIGRAKSFGSRAQFQQAQQMKMPSCDTLYRLGIGHVQY